MIFLLFKGVSEFKKMTRKNNNDASSAETHGPECKKNSKTKIGSKKGNRSEEAENKACLQKNTNKAVRISQRFRSCYNKQNQTSEGGTLTDRKIASTPGSKAKRKLAYVSKLSYYTHTYKYINIRFLIFSCWVV